MARVRTRSGVPIRSLFAALAMSLGVGASAAAGPAPNDGPAPGWNQRLHAELAKIDAHNPAEIGVYVRDLGTGESMSYRGEERWYLASTVKVIVAIAVLRGMEAGSWNLDSLLTVKESDYVDGAGHTNSYAPGSMLRVRFLIDEMIMYSDNTASDMLIRLVGIDKINVLVQSLIPQGFGQITSLADVRRYAYGNLTGASKRLSGKDFLILKRQPNDARRAFVLGLLTDTPVPSFHMHTVTEAWDAYYSTGLNSGRLDSYADLLAMLVNGAALSPDNTAYLMEVMQRVKTGTQRISAGLAPGIRFAHKTGTQRSRTCDSGVLTTSHAGTGRRVVVAACTSGEPSVTRSDRALREVGEALCKSGLFSGGGFDEHSCGHVASAPSKYDAAER
ncbi:hypothetical protein BH09PSE5_BH09PSE5_19660 [soil metagenome]